MIFCMDHFKHPIVNENWQCYKVACSSAETTLLCNKMKYPYSEHTLTCQCYILSFATFLNNNLM